MRSRAPELKRAPGVKLSKGARREMLTSTWHRWDGREPHYVASGNTLLLFWPDADTDFVVYECKIKRQGSGEFQE